MANFFLLAISAFLITSNVPFSNSASDDLQDKHHYHHHHRYNIPLNFSYTGSTGPAQWGALSPAFSACSHGKSQSPINILTHQAFINKKLKPLEIKYGKSINATLLDNGFNVASHCGPGVTETNIWHQCLHLMYVSMPNVYFGAPRPPWNWWRGKNLSSEPFVEHGKVSYGEDAGVLVLEGKIYRLKQMHWHAPSEHQINGFNFAAELHLVHSASDNSVAVLAVLFKLGHPDRILAKIQKQLIELPRELFKQQQQPRISLGNLNTHELTKLSHTHKYYRYVGSFTTPPCTENVTWTIIAKIHSISREQVAALRAPLEGTCKRNARPIQPLDGRKVELYQLQQN